jgi:hypothetical protein
MSGLCCQLQNPSLYGHPCLLLNGQQAPHTAAH